MLHLWWQLCLWECVLCGVGMGGGGDGQCVTSVVAAMHVGVCPLWELVVVVVGSVLHLWWQTCLWECVLCGNGWWWWWAVCYICGGSCACGSVSSVRMGVGGSGQCVTYVVVTVPVGVYRLWE